MRVKLLKPAIKRFWNKDYEGRSVLEYCEHTSCSSNSIIDEVSEEVERPLFERKLLMTYRKRMNIGNDVTSRASAFQVVNPTEYLEGI